MASKVNQLYMLSAVLASAALGGIDCSFHAGVTASTYVPPVLVAPIDLGGHGKRRKKNTPSRKERKKGGK